MVAHRSKLMIRRTKAHPEGGRSCDSWRRMCNSDGTRKSELRFKAWGEVRWSYDSTNSGYQFQGQYSQYLIKNFSNRLKSNSERY